MLAGTHAPRRVRVQLQDDGNGREWEGCETLHAFGGGHGCPQRLTLDSIENASLDRTEFSVFCILYCGWYSVQVRSERHQGIPWLANSGTNAVIFRGLTAPSTKTPCVSQHSS